ncbi:hypothetical protein D3C76_874070 [compost metagenome]
MWNLRLDHLATAHRREVITIGPVLGLVLDVNIELAGFERFEGHGAVAVELILDPGEVVFAAVDRQVLAPVILDPFKHQTPPRLDLSDAVGATAQRRLEGGGLEVAAFPVMRRQHRHLAQAQDQQRIAGALEDEADAPGREDVHPLNFLQAGAIERMAMPEQGAVGEFHVPAGDRPAVMEARLRTQVEHHPAAVVGVLHAAGDQAVAGRRLVPGRVVEAGAHHQRLVQLVDAVLQEVRGGDRAGALQGVGIERVERAQPHQAQGAALGGVGIDPGEVGEVRRVLERAELRVAVAFGDIGEAGEAQHQAEEQEWQATHQAWVRT